MSLEKLREFQRWHVVISQDLSLQSRLRMVLLLAMRPSPINNHLGTMYILGISKMFFERGYLHLAFEKAFWSQLLK